MSGEILTLFEIAETERVPPGYKQTGVGAIPEDWHLLPMSNLLEFRNGVNADKSAYGRGIRFINVLEVITRTHLQNLDIPGRVSLPAILVDSFEVRRGDILFNRTSETQEEVGLASVYLGDETVVFGGFVIRGRRRGIKIDDIFSGYAFRSPIIRSQIISKGQGAVRANIGQQELSKVLAAIPPLTEQRAIATALSDVDDLISSLDRLISKKQAVKTATMQQLLTRKRRLPGFSGKWQTKHVREFGDVVTGSTPSTQVKENWGEDFPWVTPTDIASTKDIRKSERHITEIGLDAIRPLPANTVLVTCIASIGKNAVLRRVGGCNQQINAIIPDSASNPDFLYYLFEYNKGRLLANAGATATSIISKKVFSNLMFCVPFVTEQTAIATVLSDMDAEMEALEARREKTRRIKQGMMQELLTGRTRLVPAGA